MQDFSLLIALAFLFQQCSKIWSWGWLTSAQSPPEGYVRRGFDTAWGGHPEVCCQYTVHLGWGVQTCCWTPVGCQGSLGAQSPPCTSTQWDCSAKGTQSAPPGGESECSSGPARYWPGSFWCGVPRHISPHQGPGDIRPSQTLGREEDPESEGDCS